VLPAIKVNDIGLRKIFGKQGVHLPSKVATQNRRVEFVVVQKAAPIQIG